MASNPLKEARKKVAFSYMHKLVLLLAACGGFFALTSLGQKKDDFDKDERWALRGPLKETVRSIADCEEMTFPQRGYATREELIVAVQECAESCIRARSTADTKKIRDKITKIEENPGEADLKTYDNLLDILEKKEAYTRTKLAAVRQHLNAALKQEKLAEDGIFPSIFDEGSSSHVIYHLLWYGSLLFALGASTLLLVVLLTALPITDGRGYWTQRISDFLDRIPGTSSRTVAAPLLAATLGAGAFAGAVAETQPGGQAWPVEDRRAYITDATSTSLTSNYEEGDWIVVDRRTYPVQPPEITWEQVTGPLQEIQGKVDGLGRKIETESGKIVAAINSANTRIEGNTELTLRIDARLQTIAGDVQAIEETGDGMLLFFRNDLGPLVKKIEHVETLVEKHSNASETAAGEVKTREMQQEETSRDVLAQSAEVDTRNAFARTFLPTVYKVGPVVPRIMRERLATIPENERKKFVDALEKMPDKALRRKKFEEALREQLRVHGLADQAEGFIENHFPSLLRVSALPRR